MAKYHAKTFLQTNNGMQITYEIELHVGRHGKIEFCKSISPEIQLARSYMFFDLLKDLMPNYLFIGTVLVNFGKIQVNNSKYDYKQPCLVVYNEQFRKKEISYLLNNLVCPNWLTSVPKINLCAMVTWWREHREEYFKKPPQVWEIKRLD